MMAFVAELYSIGPIKKKEKDFNLLFIHINIVLPIKNRQ